MSETRFGDYRITGTIGSGAVATIFRAVQERLGRVVAVKALKAQITSTSSFGEQIDREAKVLSDLTHPNVVLLLDAGRTESGRPYLVLEHIDGPTLEAVLGPSGDTARRSRDKGSKKPKLEVAAALAIGCAICAALEHVHERGIVHRDVKPSNVLLSRSGQVKLIDFGIAQRPRTLSVSDTIGTEGITASGRLAPEPLKDAFGTPAYMSPEQILGDFVDGRSDLFSLGVVLYQMLSGTRPFEGDEGEKRSAAQRIRRDAPPSLRLRAPHCPRQVERIVMRLLEKSPDDRYPSAGVVKERLEAALRAETREDVPAIVRRALALAGHGNKADAAQRRGDAATRAPSSPRLAARPAIGVSRALVGFTIIAAVFLLGAIANESTNVQAREARAAGGQALELAPDRAGGLRVLASPWAFVRVDGQLVETTPFARAIPLGPGKHFVTLSHPDAPAAIEREVTIVTGETVTLDVTMNLATEDAGKDAR
jgi:serine/threonine-protein kinase